MQVEIFLEVLMIGNHVDRVPIDNFLRLLSLSDVVIFIGFSVLASGRGRPTLPLRLFLSSVLAHRFSDGYVEGCLHFFRGSLGELALSILL